MISGFVSVVSTVIFTFDEGITKLSDPSVRSSEVALAVPSCFVTLSIMNSPSVLKVKVTVSPTSYAPIPV